MQYFHQARYGSVGQVHTMKPTMVMKGSHVYTTDAHPLGASNKPIFENRGGMLYQTAFHPGGASPHAQYRIDGAAVHTTTENVNHNHAAPHVYDLKSHA